VRRLGAEAAKALHTDVFLRLRLPEGLASDFLAAMEDRRRRLTGLVEAVPSHQPWPQAEASGSVLAARAFSIQCRRAPAWVGLMALIEDYAEVWDDPAASPRRAARATYARWGWRCSAPGCSSRSGLEEHHVVHRSRGGSNAATNRICICSFHHRQGEHGDLARCTGVAPLGLSWVLGRDGIGGWYRNERRVAAPNERRAALHVEETVAGHGRWHGEGQVTALA
jgi:hypothetical protein